MSEDWPRLRYTHATGEVLTSTDALAARLRTTAERLEDCLQYMALRDSMFNPDTNAKEAYRAASDCLDALRKEGLL